MKVLWSEGMFLTPQHFQQWDRCNARESWSRLEALFPGTFGVAELIISPAELASGNVVVKVCKVVLPDGTCVNVPEVDDTPPARLLPESGNDGGVGLYLALPEALPGRVSVQRQGKADAQGSPRFDEVTQTVEDEAGGGDSQQISFAHRNLRLLLEGESIAGQINLKIAEFVRGPTGDWKLSDRYVPPSLTLASAPILVGIVERLQATLAAKRSSLAEQRRGRGKGRLEFTAADVLGFWFLHTLNGTIPRLAHCLAHKNASPERTFGELSALAGELCTFADDSSPVELATYRADDLFGCFDEIASQIRNLLEVVVPTDHVSIPLEKLQNTIWQGRIPPDTELDHAQYFLAICGELPNGLDAEGVARSLKLASSDAIKVVLRASLPGVELRHVPRPPPSVPSRADATYYRVVPQGEYWRQVIQSRLLSLHLPETLAGLNPELIAVKR